MAVDQTPQTPENNLALRYNYTQLDARNKQVADRVSALLIAFPGVIALKKSPAEEEALMSRMATATGNELSNLLGGFGPQGKSALDFLRKNDPSGMVGSAVSSAQTVQNVNGMLDAAARGPEIALAPISVTGAGFSQFWNHLKVLGNDMDADKARHIGTAYASTLQARETERAGKGAAGIATDSLGDFWEVLASLLAWAGDRVAEYIPGTGEFMAKTFHSDANRTLADNINHRMASHDIAVAETEMTKLGQRDGIDYAQYASVVTQGATGTDRAGHDVDIQAPTADNRAPDVNSANKDENGNIIPAAPSILGVTANAVGKGKADAANKANTIFGALDTPTKAIGAAVGTSATLMVGGATAVGAVQGYAANPIQRSANEAADAAKAHEEAVAKVKSLQQKNKDVKAGKTTTGERIINVARTEAKNEEALAARKDALKEQLANAKEAAAKAKEHAEVTAERAESLRETPGKLAKAGLTPIETEGKIAWLAAAPQRFGRWLGGKAEDTVVLGKAADAYVEGVSQHIMETNERLTVSGVNKVASGVHWVLDKFSSPAETTTTAHIGSASSTQSAAKAGNTAEKVTKAAETMANTAAFSERTQKLAGWATTIAEKSRGKPWGIIAAGLAAALTATGSGLASAAEYEATPENERHGSKAAAVAQSSAKGFVWDGLGGMVGAPDFAKGDNAHGIATLANWTGLPATDMLNEVRQADAATAVDAGKVAALDAVVNGGKKTGNEYLDRVIELKAMQARGVKEVALAGSGVNPLWSIDTMGMVTHEGPAFNAIGDESVSRETTASIKEAIDLNLRLYIVKGGDMTKATAMLQPSGALTADAGLSKAAQDATKAAQKAAGGLVGSQAFTVINTSIGAVKTPEANASIAGAHNQVVSPLYS